MVSESLSPNPLPSYFEGGETLTDYKYYLALAKKNLNLILTFLIMGVTLGSIYVSRLPDQYQTSSQILLERPRATQQAPQVVLGPDIMQEDYYVTQQQIMVGPTVFRQVVDEMKLIDFFHVGAMDEAVNRLRNYLRVERVRGSRLFNLVAKSPDPQFAMNLANTAARAYIKKNFEDMLYFSKEIFTWFPEEGKASFTVEDPFGKIRQLTREELLKTLPSIQTDPTIRSLEERKNTLEAELTTLLKQYREKHPFVVKAQASLRFLQQSIEAERQRVMETLKQQSTGKLQVSTARIVEEANLPRNPSGPPRAKMVLAWSGIELVAILFFIFLWDYFDDTVHSPDDLRRKGINLPFLGPVPLIKAFEVSEEERFLITHYQRRSPVAESFRYLRVAINFSAPAEALKNLVFTSSVPSEGKSFISHNIAISLAQDGNRTLLIDADLRKPRAHQIYRMENLSGLSSYLTSEIEFDTVVRETFIENLWVILSGPVSPNPAEILASQRMVNLLKQARGRFDRIVIDAPPLTGIGDSLVLGSMTTHVIFVIRSSKTPCDIIRQSKEVLEKSGIRIIGAILNYVDIEKERYGGYYKYYYQNYSYYGQSPKPED